MPLFSRALVALTALVTLAATGFAGPRARFEMPDAESRWYPHGKWVVLRSVRGRNYWGSDALHAFLSYSTGPRGPFAVATRANYRRRRPDGPLDMAAPATDRNAPIRARVVRADQ